LLLKHPIAKQISKKQGGHKPGKPGILRDFSEHGKLREFCATSGKKCAFSLSFKYRVGQLK